MYASIDKVADKLERQIQKYKKNIFRNLRIWFRRKELVNDANIVEDSESSKIIKIVRTKRFAIKPMSVEEAAMQMD